MNCSFSQFSSKSGQKQSGDWGGCQTKAEVIIGQKRRFEDFWRWQLSGVKSSKTQPALPIGRMARIAFEIDALRSSCSRAAHLITLRNPVDAPELEDCAILDDALAEAHRVLKSSVRSVMLSRLSRRSGAE